MTARPQISFWFDFASTYAYLTLQRIRPVAEAAGVRIVWRPFLLGPIFASQGWDTSPFNVYPQKGAFMLRDVARRAAAYGLPFEPGAALPVNSVAAARLAYAALERPEGPEFCAKVSAAHWGAGRNIADPAVLEDCARDAGLDPAALGARAQDPEVKPRLRAATDDAVALGVFGAPSFTVRRGESDELFWGDDQLEDALAWALTGAMRPRR